MFYAKFDEDLNSNSVRDYALLMFAVKLTSHYVFQAVEAHT